MPNPKPNEKQKDFISRCMAEVINEGKKKDQAYAICEYRWKESRLKQIKKAAIKVSFDYDGVLSTEKGKELAKRTQGTKYIISARRNKSGMTTTAKEVGIRNIYATGSNKAKIEKIKQLGINTHWDNNPDVISKLGIVGKLFKD